MNQEELKLKYPNFFALIEEYYGADERPKKILEELILDRLGNKKKFRKNWTNGILKAIGEEIGYPTQGLTFGFIPNYGGMAEFSETLGDDKKIITQIQFYISLLRNVYTIQITEIEEVTRHNSFLNHEVQNQTLKEIWVSPSHPKYNDIFLKIESYMDRTLDNSIFLPYSIQQIRLNEIIMPHTSNEDNKVEDAFFRKILPLNQDFSILGDPDYRINELS